jgi:murein L,D-transpeptidase YafK
MKKKRIVLTVPCVLILAGLAWANNDEGSLPQDVIVDRIIVEKSFHRLTLVRNGSPLKTYQIALGRNPVGKKVRQGDNRTPEGIYRIDHRNANSRFYRSLHISYPNRKNIEKARKLGVSPGGGIMIHGLPPEIECVGSMHRQVDWTAGCVAVTNSEIDEIWRVVPDGTIIEIRP